MQGGCAEWFHGRRRDRRRFHQAGKRESNAWNLCAVCLTSGATAPDKVIDELKQYDFEIISTNLPEEQERKLREAFAQE